MAHPWTGPIILILLCLPLVFAIIIRCILSMVCWFLKTKYGVKVKLGNISFYAIKTLCIQLPNGISIEAESVWLSSSIISRRHPSLIAICLSDLRLQGDFAKLLSQSRRKKDSPPPGQDDDPHHSGHHRMPSTASTASSSSNISDDGSHYGHGSGLSAANWKKLVKIFRWLRRISISIDNTSLMQLGLLSDKVKQGCLLHTTLQQLTLKFDEKKSKREPLKLRTTLCGIALKLLKQKQSDHKSHNHHHHHHYRRDSLDQDYDEEHKQEETCLAHVSFNLITDFYFDQNEGLLIEVNVHHPQINLFEGIPFEEFEPTSSPFSSLNSSPASTMEKELKALALLRTLTDRLPFQKCFVKVETSTLKLMREQGQKTLTMELETIEIEIMKLAAKNENGKGVEGRLVVTEFKVLDTHQTFFSMNRMNVIINMERERSLSRAYNVFLIAELTSCHMVYNLDELRYWTHLVKSSSSSSIASSSSASLTSLSESANTLSSSSTLSTIPPNSLPLQSSASNPLPNGDTMSAPVNSTSIFEQLLKQDQQSFIKFSVSIEVSDLSYSFKRDPIDVIYGLSHSKLSVIINPDALFREMSGEVLLESVWCWSGDATIRPKNPNSLKKYHQKHVPLFINLFILKMRYSNMTDFRIQCINDCSQLSWDYFSKEFDEVLPDVDGWLALSPIASIRTPSTPGSSNSSSSSPSKSSYRSQNETFTNFSFQLNINSLNIFIDDLMLRLDSVSFESTNDKITGSLSGIAINTLYAPPVALTCLKARELKKMRVLYFACIRINCSLDNKEMFISFNEEVTFVWNAGFHLVFKDFIEDIQRKFLRLKAAKIISPSKSLTKLPFIYIKVNVQGKIAIGASLSNDGRCMSIESASLSILVPSSNRLNFTSDQVSVYFDQHQILKCESVDIRYLSENDASSILNRKAMTEPVLELKKNRLLYICIDSSKIFFPYDYNFSDTFKERFMTTIKWLKQLHGKKADRYSETVSMDLVIKAQYIVMEVADDPFEVKLRDNYELLEDEYHESLKRTRTLTEKIEKMKKEAKIKPTSNMDELYQALAKKNADIYIERHKKLYSTEPMRTKLFTVQVEAFLLESAADFSLAGYERLISLMQQIDREAPFHEDLSFSTIWGRRVSGSIASGGVFLRDFSKPMMEVTELKFRGIVIGAEQEATSRARRTCYVDLGPGKESIAVNRSMTTLKFYHHLNLQSDYIGYTHGACWEPVLQQVNLSFEKINRPSCDPSPSLPWWDKMRFLFHGPLLFVNKKVSIIFHASLDPYNQTEFMEISLPNSTIDWLTGKITVHGDLDFLVRSASKYDECRLVHIPRVLANISLNWVCAGNQYDHHSVMPCAPDKVPEYSSNQTYDSYRLFRSRNLDASIHLGTKQSSTDTTDRIPQILLFNSTLRWLEKKLFVFRGMARLTRRGKLFRNTKPRKTPFGRIFKHIRVTINLHKFQISCWTSFNKIRGLQVLGLDLNHSAQHTLTLVPITDGLIHRPRPVWELDFMNTGLRNVEIWLFNRDVPPNPLASKEEEHEFDMKDRQYFMQVHQMSYDRPNTKAIPLEPDSDNASHRLIIHGLRGAWTKSNRDVIFGLFDSYMKAQALKRNLSSEALKGIRVDGQNQASPSRRRSQSSSQPHSAASTTSPSSTLSKNHAASMLQKLIAELADQSDRIVYTEDMGYPMSENPQLYGLSACKTDDVISKNWLIELINSQVLLKGCETAGYVIVSAAKTEILQRIHKPVWNEGRLFSKTTWVGSVDCMQYYATVNSGNINDVVWLDVKDIEEKNTMYITDLPDWVGSGTGVGGVVTDEVGTAAGGTDSSSLDLGTLSATKPELQRIVSRCGCQFFYASYGENVEPEELEEVPPPPNDENDVFLESWDKDIAVDSFTLIHHDLEISTNSQQFDMIVDMVNNLLLYVEPHKKEAFEKLQRLRFGFHLNDEDKKTPILKLQDRVRSSIAYLNQLEREHYMIEKTLAEATLSELDRHNLHLELDNVKLEMEKYKDLINREGEDLARMISVYKEMQVSADKARERQLAAQQTGGTFIPSIIRRSEISFIEASWRLTDADGQIGLAHIRLKNFLYSKVTRNDDSVEHLFELENIHVENLNPNQITSVLQPTELQPNIPLDRRRALRIFCRERAPVAGISVKEHLEVNLVPITICVTDDFYKKMDAFFFPGKNSPNQYGASLDAKNTAGGRGKRRGRKAITGGGSNASQSQEQASMSGSQGNLSMVSSASSGGAQAATLTAQSIASTETSKSDDIEKMRERASKNHTFVYVKVPEVPIRVSYKGKRIDLNNVYLTLPTFEYHNSTWRWLDLVNQIKNDCKTIVIRQALKQKMKLQRGAPSITSSVAPPSASPVVQVVDDVASTCSSRSDLDDVSSLMGSQSRLKDEDEPDPEKARLLLGDLAGRTLTQSQTATGGSSSSSSGHKFSLGFGRFSHKK